MACSPEGIQSVWKRTLSWATAGRAMAAAKTATTVLRMVPPPRRRLYAAKSGAGAGLFGADIRRLGRLGVFLVVGADQRHHGLGVADEDIHAGAFEALAHVGVVRDPEHI